MYLLGGKRMQKQRIEEADYYSTGYSYTLSLISGKYKPAILYCLMEYEPVRFNEMQRYLKKIADKTLSQNLKELEADDLIPPESRILPDGARSFTCESTGQAL